MIIRPRHRIRFRPSYAVLLLIMAALAAFIIASPTLAAPAAKADLAARAALSDLTPIAGQPVLIRGEIRNVGPDAADTPTLTVSTATYTVLTITPPAGFSCSYAADLVTCTRATPFAAGARGVVYINAVAEPTPDARPRPRATVSSPTFDGVKGNNSALAQSNLP